YEASEYQVNYANQMLGKKYVHCNSLDGIETIIENLKTDVVSLVGVLEHLQHPDKVLSALSMNNNIKYFFFSLPLFSTGIFFELVFPHVMPRQIAGGHTHLYTESSIKHFCKQYRFEKISEWWFGMDIYDLFRNVWVTLEKSKDFQNIVPLWSSLFEPLLDDLQLAIDKRHVSSEVHMVVKN
ncbi:hypothetical protein MHK_004187, partial [Candidatus Magnetomorum sp. HK-1]